MPTTVISRTQSQQSTATPPSARQLPSTMHRYRDSPHVRVASTRSSPANLSTSTRRRGSAIPVLYSHAPDPVSDPDPDSDQLHRHQKQRAAATAATAVELVKWFTLVGLGLATPPVSTMQPSMNDEEGDDDQETRERGRGVVLALVRKELELLHLLTSCRDAIELHPLALRLPIVHLFLFRLLLNSSILHPCFCHLLLLMTMHIDRLPKGKKNGQKQPVL